jgi:simple sugar transport system substrate-binding protein
MRWIRKTETTESVENLSNPQSEREIGPKTELAGTPPLSMRRREVLRTMALGGATAAGASVFAGMTGFSMLPRAFAAGMERGQFPAHPKWRFVFVNHVTTNPFFVPTQYGIQDACALTGCTYQWTGSETSQVTEMVNAIEAAIAARVDGIATSIIDPHAFNQPIARALAAGIPVVAYNADAPASSHNPRMAYIGQDLFLSGQKMGEQILKVIPKGGHIGLFIATPGSLNIQPRIDGAIAAIKAAGNPISYDVVATGALVEQELNAIESYYLGHKTVKGMFAVDGGSTQSVGQVMAKYQLQKHGVHGGGFDLLPLTLEYIHRGILDFTIDQQPYVQGYYPVIQLYLYKLSGGLMFPSDTDTGLKFVTRENVRPYLTTTSRFEGSSAQEKDLA